MKILFFSCFFSCMLSGILCANVIEAGPLSFTTKSVKPSELLLMAVQDRDYFGAEALLNSLATTDWNNGDIHNNLRYYGQHIFMRVWNSVIGLESQLVVVNRKDANGRSVLHYAAELGDVRMIKLLLSHQANVDATDDTGRTALHLAVQLGELDAAFALVMGKASIMLKDANGTTPLQIAIDQANYGMAKMMVLCTHYVTAEMESFLGWTDYHRAAYCNDTMFIRQTAKSNARTQGNRQDKLGFTALHYAAMRNYRFFVIEFVGRFAVEIDSTDFEGKTPLHHAAQEGHHDVVSDLFGHFANIYRTDKNGNTPYDLAKLNVDIQTMAKIRDLIAFDNAQRDRFSQWEMAHL